MVPYDIVVILCPRCGHPKTVQSTSGQCLMTSYPLELAPEDVLIDVIAFGKMDCESCRLWFMVKRFEDGQVRAVEWIPREGRYD